MMDRWNDRLTPVANPKFRPIEVLEADAMHRWFKSIVIQNRNWPPGELPNGAWNGLFLKWLPNCAPSDSLLDWGSLGKSR